jgi:hypothetical protein
MCPIFGVLETTIGTILYGTSEVLFEHVAACEMINRSTGACLATFNSPKCGELSVDHAMIWVELAVYRRKAGVGQMWNAVQEIASHRKVHFLEEKISKNTADRL